MFRKILVVENISLMSDKPFLAAVAFSKMYHSSIVDLSVVEPGLFNGHDERARSDGAEVEKHHRLVAQGILNEHASFANAVQLNCRSVIVQSPTPSDEILNVARQHGCDVIFIDAQKNLVSWKDSLKKAKRMES